ncbi:hypothetical protein K440DRAFT_270942 [Wilcoxina mikolae CBS 423.85]|nr:hypothetical protein K440DRAFT_270942 [Wilcoxina mikolae CBS 423.85]
MWLKTIERGGVHALAPPTLRKKLSIDARRRFPWLGQLCLFFFLQIPPLSSSSSFVSFFPRFAD